MLHGAHRRHLANTIEPSIFNDSAKMAEPIEMQFGVWTRLCPMKHVLDGVQIVPCQGAIFRGKDMPEHVRVRVLYFDINTTCCNTF